LACHPYSALAAMAGSRTLWKDGVTARSLRWKSAVRASIRWAQKDECGNCIGLLKERKWLLKSPRSILVLFFGIGNHQYRLMLCLKLRAFLFRE